MTAPFLLETDGAPRTCRPPHTGRPIAAKRGSGKPAFPYIPAKAELPELTWSAVIMGSMLGIIFGARRLPVPQGRDDGVGVDPGRRAGDHDLPGPVDAFGIRRTTILENNIIQTAGSAGESIAFGVGATMPALMLLGYEMEWSRVMLVSVLGGLLGILMMIPLAPGLHRQTARAPPLSRGTACAKVLIVGEQGGSNAGPFSGFRPRVSLPDPDAGVQVLVGRMAAGNHGHHGLQKGVRFTGAVADFAGRWLYHRAADRLGDGRWRRPDGAVSWYR